MTIVADASAILAILLDEPDAAMQMSKLLAAQSVSISPVNWWEVNECIRKRRADGGVEVATEWMKDMGIEIEPVTAHHAQLALDARARYGGRPARLNMGDCFAYALARSKNVPLLYKGGDFSATDVQSA